MHSYDVVVIGAGAAGLMCAATAGQAGRRVLVVDHAERVAEKIRISGGGRCNFTNRDAGPANFVSANPHFCRSALARYTPQDFLALLARHGVAWHEKHRGQLFCDDSSRRIVDLLLAECAAGSVERWQPCTVHDVRRAGDAFELDTARGSVRAARVVVATGGLSIPKLGATDFGYRLARRFGHAVVEPRPALVPLTFDAAAWAPYAPLAGVSLAAGVACRDGAFVEDLLFTHRGLSGPAILQISLYWRPGDTLAIDLLPGRDAATELLQAKRTTRRQLAGTLAGWLPARLAQAWLQRGDTAALAQRPLPELADRELQHVAAALQRWTLVPTGSEGWRKAEVTAGGVDTRELSSQSMESRRCPGLHFIGEVVDVTGWLGGYNFQWAWASAVACGRALGAG